ncbi:acyl-CoA dehydrogenase family protein [Mycolicibacterium pyrenivorans]|uniref:acyl-CoA dehydrogenase family protein n=1 Tax=Mycolicibacterium pyrenivorans TaxID=187102 RepID=UPI0021F317BB|nr:acyl-CoA dehydrogenase family protein [Mycolicibacterium pyrenivorans]MCV7153326.1 acyl-CoA dehydrogenase family protein [Mycolicibacterium pyrenivorans]
MSDRPPTTGEPKAWTPEEFRNAVRQWFREHIHPLTEATCTDEDRKQVTAAAYDAGLLHPTWPVAYGGGGLSPVFQTVFNEESAVYSWALIPSTVTVGICAATLLDSGTDEQKRRHIPAMLRGDEDWTQLLSEPGAGSDLGGVATRATRHGDEFVLNGQKVWTSGAADCNYAAALVRTDAAVPKYKGLSMVIVDMSSPGVDVRPLRQMTGDAHFNEVFLDDVRVPVANLMGEYNGGWGVLNRMLMHERIALSAGTTAGSIFDPNTFDELLTLARARGVDADAAVRARLADIYIDKRLLDFMGRRMRAAAAAGLEMGPVGSIGKIGIARNARSSAEAAVLIGGPDVLAWEPGDLGSERWARDLLIFPMTAIAGGTTEIQKNTVAERLLGLPRERHADRGVPFSQIAKDPSGIVTD